MGPDYIIFIVFQKTWDPLQYIKYAPVFNRCKSTVISEYTARTCSLTDTCLSSKGSTSSLAPRIKKSAISCLFVLLKIIRGVHYWTKLYPRLGYLGFPTKVKDIISTWRKKGRPMIPTLVQFYFSILEKIFLEKHGWISQKEFSCKFLQLEKCDKIS